MAKIICDYCEHGKKTNYCSKGGTVICDGELNENRKLFEPRKDNKK